MSFLKDSAVSLKKSLGLHSDFVDFDLVEFDQVDFELVDFDLVVNQIER